MERIEKKLKEIESRQKELDIKTHKMLERLDELFQVNEKDVEKHKNKFEK